MNEEVMVGSRLASVCIKKPMISSALFAVLYIIAYLVDLTIRSSMPLIPFCIYLGYLLFLLSNKRFFIEYIWAIVMVSWIVIADGLLVINPIWMNELQTLTFDNGSLLPIAAAATFFLQCLFCFDCFCPRGFRIKKKEFADLIKEHRGLIRASGTFVLLLMVLSFAAVAFNPAWLSSSDRFSYAQNMLPVFLQKYQAYLVVLVPAVLPCWFAGFKKTFAFSIVFYILYLVWTGEKFTSIFLLCYILLLCYLAIGYRDFDAEKGKEAFAKIKRAALTIAAAFIALTVIQYINLFGSVGSAASIFEQRIAAQGEVWWGVYTAVEDVPLELRNLELEDEFAPLFKMGDTTEERQQGGMYKLMRIVMTPEYYTNYINKSTRLTSSTPSTLYYYFGFSGLLIGMCLLAGCYFLLINKTLDSIASLRIADSMICVYLIRVMHGVLIMSDFADLFSARTFLLILMLIFLSIFKNDAAHHRLKGLSAFGSAG